MISARTVSRISRILTLIPYVLERSSAEVDEVVERFGYTREQLARDLDTVFVCGLPGYGPGDLMEAYIDEDEVVIDAADYFSRAPRLTSIETLGLLAAGMTVIGAGEGSPALESAVSKLSRAILPDASRTLVVDVEDESENVGVLRQAAADGRVVEITYRSVGKEQTSTRRVEPWGVFATLGRWYVVGHCRMVEGERTFRVDRIRALEVLDETFDRPEEVSLPGVGYSPSDDDVVCVIDLSPRSRWVLEYFPVEVLSESAKRTRIRFSSADAELPARLMLRLGGGARLVEGAEVAERIRDLGGRLRALYR